MKKYNKYDLSGEYGIGWTSNTNEEFYFDLEDYDLIKDYCWYVVYNGEGNYKSLRATELDSSKYVKFHHIIGCKYHDHINRNPLDNRKCNLRTCTGQQNLMNRSMQGNNTSGFIGVDYSNRRQRWRARINIDGKSITVYYGESKEDAIIARLQAEKEHYGEFAPQRHLFELYGIA